MLTLQEDDFAQPWVEGRAVELYAVFKQGVQRHECAGVVSTVALAEATARSCLVGESDDYHTYVVVAFCLDVPTLQEPLKKVMAPEGAYVDGGELKEGSPVSRWSREGGAVRKEE